MNFGSEKIQLSELFNRADDFANRCWNCDFRLVDSDQLKPFVSYFTNRIDCSQPVAVAEPVVSLMFLQYELTP